MKEKIPSEDASEYTEQISDESSGNSVSSLANVHGAKIDGGNEQGCFGAAPENASHVTNEGIWTIS